MKKIILILISIIAIASGCKKNTLNKFYGVHTLRTYTVDDVDSIDYYFDSLGTSFQFYYNEVDYENIGVIYGERKDGRPTMVNWNWELSNNNKYVQIICGGFSIGTGPFGVGKNNLEWHILEITKKNIKMETNYNNKVYMIELEKK